MAAGHRVTAIVRNPSKLPPEARSQVSVHAGDPSTLAPSHIARLLTGHDALISYAGYVTEGRPFAALIDRLATGAGSPPAEVREVCRFIAGAPRRPSRIRPR